MLTIPNHTQLQLPAIAGIGYWYPQHLQVYLRFDLKAIALEVEIVFWNDITFPQNLRPDEREQRLEALLSLAEACRNGFSDARCILAAEHNGPVKELLELESTVIW